METSAINRSVPLRIKIPFWLLLGGLSILFAEVVATSSPFPFFTLWGVLGVLPLYSLHVLVLAYFTFGKHRITFPILFLAGALLGMYEAYITKVFWDPTWGGKNFEIGGIYPLQTFVLVLFWHPFMAYILPVFLAENLFTDSSETFTALPKKIQNILSQKWIRVLVLFSIYCALYIAFGAANWYAAFLSSALNMAIVSGLALFWIRVKGTHQLTLRDLLPSRKQAVTLGLMLALIYLGSGFFLRSEALPRTIGPHLTVWIMYAILFTLIYFNIKRSTLAVNEVMQSPVKASRTRTAWIFGILLTSLSVLFFQIKIVAVVIIVTSWIAGCILGLFIIIHSLHILLKK